MYLQHFGLKFDPLGKASKNHVSHEQYTPLKNKLDQLILNKGIGLITGQPGSGKTTAVRQWVSSLNPLSYEVIYQSDNHFRAFDIYCRLADSLGMEKYHRYSKLWCLLKEEILRRFDEKNIGLVWILDEAHALPNNFLRELPAFLNFSFDSRDVLSIIMIADQSINGTINRSAYAALTSRMLFNYHWQVLNVDDFETFIIEAFKNAGKEEAILSKTGIRILHMASKGVLRNANKTITLALQIAMSKNLNHLSDECLEESIENLKNLTMR